MQTIERMYLHWSATPYSWRETGDYHCVIDDAGVAHRLTDYHEPLHAHTYGRNYNSIAIAMACMGGTPWDDYPPTDAQLDGMAKECAKVAVGLGWPADVDKLKHLIMTHAEAAALRDYPLERVQPFSGHAPSDAYDGAAQSAGLPHANYGPATWHDGWPGGDVFRWDLWQLKPGDRGGSGGFLMRQRIVVWMHKLQDANQAAHAAAGAGPR